MDTTRYAKPRPCLPSLQRSRVGRARAVSLDEVSDRSLSRDDLVWETRMCLQPSTAPSIDDLGFDEEDAYDEGEVECTFENSRIALDRVVAVIFTQRTLDAIGRRDAHVLSTIVRAAASSGHDQL